MIYLSDENGHPVECNFRLEDAERLGIETRVSPGISQHEDYAGQECSARYALCPVCSKNGSFGHWRNLQDAIKCCGKESDDELYIQGTILMSSKIALVATSRKLALDWVKMYKVKRQNVIILNTKEDLKKLRDHQIIFVGKCLDFYKHPLIKEKIIREEFQKKLDYYDYNFHVVCTSLYSESIFEVETYDKLVEFKKALDVECKKDPDFKYKVFVRGAVSKYGMFPLIPQ